MFSCTVPSESPANISTVMITSTSVSLEWDALSPPDRNGMITGYLLHYVRLNTGNVVSVHSPTTDAVIYQLVPHTAYTFYVAARTTVGIGPFSTHLQVTTAESG